MLETFRKKPLLAALVVIFLYGIWLTAPLLFGFDAGEVPDDGIEEGISHWVSELVVGTALIIIITLLKWWKVIGFRRMNPGSVKFLLPMALLAVIFILYAWSIDTGERWFLGFIGPWQLLSLAGVMLALGFVEEGIFRGILFHGLETKVSPFYTVILSALLFGLFHYVNLIDGKPFIETSYQAIHAAALGFLYASLRLRIGAIWPLILLHGLWDFSLFLLLSSTAEKAAPVSEFSLSIMLVMSLPATLYGIFIYWRWKKNGFKIDRLTQPGNFIGGDERSLKYRAP